jgi:ABC-type Na+ transport system ATPase subunit NatA
MSLIPKSVYSHKKGNELLLRIVKNYIEANKDNIEVDSEDIKSFKDFVFKELKYTKYYFTSYERLSYDLIIKYFISLQNTF